MDSKKYESKEYKNKDLTVSEVLKQLLQSNSNNCQLVYSANDLEFTIDFTVVKIKNGDVIEYQEESKLDIENHDTFDVSSDLVDRTTALIARVVDDKIEVSDTSGTIH